MLFRKKIEKSCAYCAHSVQLEEGQILCSKKGVRTLPNKCRKFQYDITKRVPPHFKPCNFAEYDKKDFSL